MGVPTPRPPTERLRIPSVDERALLCAALGLAPAWCAGPSTFGARGYDWAFLSRYAIHHLTLPPLAAAVAGLPIAMPSSVRALFADAVTQTALRREVLLFELDQVTRLFAARGIRCVALKGMALAAHRPDYFLRRHTNDIDLWIDPARFQDARRTLEEAGFREVWRGEGPDVTYSGAPRPARQHAEDDQYATLVGKRGTGVDLHRRLPHRCARTWDDAFRSAVTVCLGGVSATVPDEATLLLDLSGHVVLHHASQPLLWPRHLLDVAALVEGHDALLAEASRRATPSERFALRLTVHVLRELRARVGGGVAARALVFPRSGVDPQAALLGLEPMVRLSRRMFREASRGPRSFARALWPSHDFLRSLGFSPEGLGVAAHVRRWRSVLTRVRHPE